MIFFFIPFALLMNFTYRDRGLPLAAPFALFAVLPTVLSSVIPEAHLPSSKDWLRFGFLLCSLVGSIVLNVISFVLITPLGITIRIFGCRLSNGRIISSLLIILQQFSYRMMLHISESKQLRYNEPACDVAQLC